ncbi:MAG: hypothetical protein RR505_03225 [Raoultibacter sp.]
MEIAQQSMCRSILKMMRDPVERKRFEEWKRERVKNAERKE